MWFLKLDKHSPIPDIPPPCKRIRNKAVHKTFSNTRSVRTRCPHRTGRRNLRVAVNGKAGGGVAAETHLRYFGKMCTGYHHRRTTPGRTRGGRQRSKGRNSRIDVGEAQRGRSSERCVYYNVNGTHSARRRNNSEAIAAFCSYLSRAAPEGNARGVAEVSAERLTLAPPATVPLPGDTLASVGTNSLVAQLKVPSLSLGAGVSRAFSTRTSILSMPHASSSKPWSSNEKSKDSLLPS